jgi:proline dehydrogenase
MAAGRTEIDGVRDYVVGKAVEAAEQAASERALHRAEKIDARVEALRDARLRRTGRRLQKRKRVVEDSSSDSECERGE